jgi:hypothetical protein
VSGAAASRQEKPLMPTIRANDGVVTHVNTFHTSPQNQDALVASLTETVDFAATLPGWISASIHKSLDGTRVINYVQFESQAAADSVTRQLLASGHIQRNTRLGRVEPAQYTVAYTKEKP